jgi:phage gpG-like protein
MGVQFNMKVLGLQALLKACRPETVKEPVNEGIRKLAIWTQRTLMVSTPVDIGRLKGSMTKEVYGDVAKIGTNVEYGQFVEYGTKFMAPRHVIEGSSARVKGIGPFMYTMQKLQAKVGEFLQEIGKAIEVRFG